MVTVLLFHHLSCHQSSLTFFKLKQTNKQTNTVAVLRLRCCAWALSSCGKCWLLYLQARASHCSGFSCCRAWALGAWASVLVVRGLRSCGSQAPEHRFSLCDTRVSSLHSMWNLPGREIEPMSPALAGGFLTTGPPAKSF